MPQEIVDLFINLLRNLYALNATPVDYQVTINGKLLKNWVYVGIGSIINYYIGRSEQCSNMYFIPPDFLPHFRAVQKELGLQITNKGICKNGNLYIILEELVEYTGEEHDNSDQWIWHYRDGQRYYGEHPESNIPDRD